MRKFTGLQLAAALTAPVLLLAACGKSTGADATTSAPAPSAAAASATGAPAQSPAAAGGQPDVNGDGKVVVGVMSPGDTNDKGYYQGFVDEARAFADARGWTTIVVDRINPTDGINQATNLCRQKVDLIAIGASELKDSLAATTDPACAGVNWYISTTTPVDQTEYFTQSNDYPDEQAVAAGYAAGLLLKEKGGTSAGYISGPELPFSSIAAKGFLAGLRLVVPEAKLAVTFTGDFDDSAKAKEAAQAQIAAGVQVIWPYLGGATDAVAALANEHDVATLTPGGNRCEDPSVHYDISVIYSPGAYFAAALSDFENGKLPMGGTRSWRIGVDPVPTVIMCDPNTALQPQVDQAMKDIAAGTIDVQSLVAAASN